VLSATSGSSALTSGAVDLEYDDPSAGLTDAEALAFATALGLWRLGACRIATRQGVVRRVAGLDRSLLDLEPLAGRRVAVADVDRDDWDGPALARCLAATPWAERTRTEFSSVPIDGRREGAERRISAYDFAAFHDHEERLQWLGARLRGAPLKVDAWLLGPWLGTDISVAERMRQVVGLPLGEATSPPGGPAGARLERACDRLLADTGVKRGHERVQALERAGTEWRATGEHNVHVADAVVLAVGGVAAGGLALSRDSEGIAHGFRLNLELGVRVALDGHDASTASSLFGPNFEVTGLGALERVGVALADQGLVRSSEGAALPRLAAAGDCVEGRPRSLLEAARAGCRAVSAVFADT
jgi:hypothetical protein